MCLTALTGGDRSRQRTSPCISSSGIAIRCYPANTREPALQGAKPNLSWNLCAEFFGKEDAAELQGLIEHPKASMRSRDPGAG